jgi:NAD-dependent SIR2 family protein deacetylase
MNNKTKTVYILGAGFSIEAQAPSQERIVQKIFEIHKSDHLVLKQEKIEEFIDFLRVTMNIPEALQETIPLEDIFTPLDRCIADNMSFRNLSVENLKGKRELILELIGKTLQHLLENSNKEYINIFAEYLVNNSEHRREHNFKDDRVSVISTNWDILLDNSLYNEINKRKYLGVVDYCCYISSYDEDDKKVKPGLEILGMGGYNVKLLKLHGSLNWLQCPRCHRLYAKFNSKIAMNPYQDIRRPSCRHCDKNFENNKSHELISNLIMPTFLKDLSNPQYKIIWQNAGIELSEAKKIVFIGYSLPQADFEMRQLLSRMVAKETEIEVVDFEDPNDNGVKFKALIKNYEQFFGRKITPFGEGTSNYINSEIKSFK